MRIFVKLKISLSILLVIAPLVKKLRFDTELHILYHLEYR
jgi:hypothetical protein